MKKIIIFIIVFHAIIFKAEAQAMPVNIQDSIALVDLYNATNGQNWINSANWLIGPVETWFGVSVDTLYSPIPYRVAALHLEYNNLSGFIPVSFGNLSHASSITLNNNNLTGNIPQTIGRMKNLGVFDVSYNQLSGNLTDSISGLTNIMGFSIAFNNFTGSISDSMTHFASLTTLYINNNQIYGLPNFSVLPHAYSVFLIQVQNNLLTFEDIEPNMVVVGFACAWCDTFYAPQFDSINNKIDTTIQFGSVFSMHCTIGGQHNVYQWSKDGIDIISATDSVLTLNNAVFADSGIYSCRVTNSVVPGLAFYRRPITVYVVETTGNFDNIKQSNGLKIYPNPSTNSLYIENSIKNSQIFISDILGNIKIKQKTNSNNTPIDISGMEKGVYFIKVMSEKGIVVKKFVKE